MVVIYNFHFANSIPSHKICHLDKKIELKDYQKAWEHWHWRKQRFAWRLFCVSSCFLLIRIKESDLGKYICLLYILFIFDIYLIYIYLYLYIYIRSLVYFSSVCFSMEVVEASCSCYCKQTNKMLPCQPASKQFTISTLKQNQIRLV